MGVTLVTLHHNLHPYNRGRRWTKRKRKLTDYTIHVQNSANCGNRWIHSSLLNTTICFPRCGVWAGEGPFISSLVVKPPFPAYRTINHRVFIDFTRRSTQAWVYSLSVRIDSEMRHFFTLQACTCVHILELIFKNQQLPLEIRIEIRNPLLWKSISSRTELKSSAAVLFGWVWYLWMNVSDFELIEGLYAWSRSKRQKRYIFLWFQLYRQVI
jgi:hypothetical protein